MVSPRTEFLRQRNRELLRHLEENSYLLSSKHPMHTRLRDSLGSTAKKSVLSDDQKRRPIRTTTASLTKVNEASEEYLSDDSQELLYDVECPSEKFRSPHAEDAKESRGNTSLFPGNKESFVNGCERMSRNISNSDFYGLDSPELSQYYSAVDILSVPRQKSLKQLQKFVHNAVGEFPEKALENQDHYLNTKRRQTKQSSLRSRCYDRDSDRMSLLEQELAASAQMHAPTHTHSVSNCYCTRNGSAGDLPRFRNSKYAVQLYGRKRHIPARLKGKRFKAEPLQKQTKGVTWAPDSLCTDDAHQCCKHDEYSNVAGMEHGASDMGSSLSNANEDQKDDWFKELKRFREMHWSDCHMSPRHSPVQRKHECLSHYVVNDRLFLDPVHADFEKRPHCPVCALPIQDSKLPFSPDLVRSTPPSLSTSEKTHTLITLPKLLLDPDFKQKPEPLAAERKPIHLVKRSEQSCFLTHHNSGVFRGQYHLRPADSLALRFQKGSQ